MPKVYQAEVMNSNFANGFIFHECTLKEPLFLNMLCRRLLISPPQWLSLNPDVDCHQKYWQAPPVRTKLCT